MGTYTATLAKDLSGLIQSFRFASKVLEDTVSRALTLLQENKSIKAMLARGQSFASSRQKTFGIGKYRSVDAGSTETENGWPRKGAVSDLSNRDALKRSATQTSATV